MAQRPDDTILADKVMFLIRTKYSEWKSKDLPFDAAFMELMDKYGVAGHERYPIKQSIGRILGVRRKTPKKQGHMPKMVFVVESRSRARIILLCTMFGSKIVYCRNHDGSAVNTSCEGHPPEVAITQGAEEADRIFAEMDQEAIRASEITVVSKGDEKLVLKLGHKFTALFMRGKQKSVRTLVVLGEEEVKHKDVPGTLLEEAKAIAREYFKDTRTGDLFAC